MEEELAAEEKNINYNTPEYEKTVYAENSCEITVKVALSLKKFLMTKVIEKLMGSTIMKEISSISGVILLQKKGGIPYLQTEGVNFDILPQFPFLDCNNVRSNDIQAVSKKFGVILNLCRYKLLETS